MFSVRELSARTFGDFEKLAFKEGSCWCTFYQRARPAGGGEQVSVRRESNRKFKEALVRQKRSHATLVYDEGRPVGWCQYGEADELPRIDAGRGYKKVGRPAEKGKLWRITCFFVDREYRGRGVSKFALHSALLSIGWQGGGIVEAYPVVSSKMAAVPEWRWFGTPSMFRREGFTKVAPLGTSGVLMRKIIRPTSKTDSS